MFNDQEPDDRLGKALGEEWVRVSADKALLKVVASGQKRRRGQQGFLKTVGESMPEEYEEAFRQSAAKGELNGQKVVLRILDTTLS